MTEDEWKVHHEAVSPGCTHTIPRRYWGRVMDDLLLNGTSPSHIVDLMDRQYALACAGLYVHCDWLSQVTLPSPPADG